VTAVYDGRLGWRPLLRSEFAEWAMRREMVGLGGLSYITAKGDPMTDSEVSKIAAFVLREVVDAIHVGRKKSRAILMSARNAQEGFDLSMQAVEEHLLRRVAAFRGDATRGSDAGATFLRDLAAHACERRTEGLLQIMQLPAVKALFPSAANGEMRRHDLAPSASQVSAEEFQRRMNACIAASPALLTGEFLPVGPPEPANGGAEASAEAEPQSEHGPEPEGSYMTRPRLL
jgi:hypothetical protein